MSRELRGLQEHLGDINDIAHVRAIIAKLLRETEAKKDRAGRALCRRPGGGLVRRPAAADRQTGAEALEEIQATSSRSGPDQLGGQFHIQCCDRGHALVRAG